MKNNASLLYNAFLVVSDFLALVLAFVGAFILRVSLSDTPIAHPISALTYLGVFLSLLPFWILLFALLGLYNSTIYERRFAEAGRLLVGSFIGMLFVVFWNFISVNPILPAKLIPIYGFGLAFLLLLIFRNIVRLIRTELFSFNIGLTNVVIVGGTAVSQELADSLANSRRSGYRLLAVIGGKETKVHRGVQTFGSFPEYLESRPQNLHGIIQTELYSNETRNAEILTYAQEHHITYRFVPGNSELFVGNIDVELFRSGVPVIHVHHTALFGWGRIIKRLSDIFLGGLLLILSLPVMLVIALLMKLAEPKAPVFYYAPRLTRFATTIKIRKFRTMKQAYNGLSPEEGFAKLGKPELAEKYRAQGDFIKRDPRVSRTGRFLRATSLDELPQLFNVVYGDISLVGPRALDVRELESYSKKNLILSVKSGLTGLAVVSGRHAMSFDERRKLDLYYVQNWSFWLDLIILVKTVRVVLERVINRGAR